MRTDNRSICFFSHSSMLGGAERSLLDLMKICVDEGIRCSIVMEGEGALKRECLKYGIEVKSTKINPWWATISESDFERASMDIIAFLQNELEEIVTFVKNQNATIIYTQTIVSPVGAIVAETMNLPHIWAIREYGEKDHRLKFIFGFKESMEKMFATSDYVLSVSHDVSQTVLDKNATNENVRVNYSHIAIPKEYQKQEISLFKNKRIKIGVFGSIAKGKNQKDAINASINLLENGYPIELYMVGQQNRDYFKSLSQLIADSQYKEHFIFIDFVENPYEIMSQMDIVLSCAVSEAMGRTLFEAILLKKPIIYSDKGGAVEIFEDTIHGLAYRLYDTHDLADKIITTIKKPLETKKRVETAYKYVAERFNAQNYSQPLLDAMDQIEQKSMKPKEKSITGFIMEKIQKQLYERVMVLEQRVQVQEQQLSQMEEKVLEKEKQIQHKEEQIHHQKLALYESELKMKEQEQQLQDKVQLLHEKERQIQHLHELAQSMRIKNRLKRNIKKLFPQKLYKIVKYMKNNPSSLKMGLVTFKTEGVAGLIKKINKIDRVHPEIVEKNYSYKEPVLTKEIEEEMRAFSHQPLISIIMPVYNVEPKWLDLAIKSVKKQWYKNWELCIVDDKSTNKKTISYLKSIDNPKIKVKFLEKNLNISGASNEALKLATGEYVALMDNDDEITPDAFYEVVKVINKHEADFIYSDEDKIEIDGLFSTPHFKPDFSPDMFLSQNYISHLGVIKRTLFDKVGGFCIGLEGAQDYDLYLKVLEQTQKIIHIPKVLYHWRKVDGSTAMEFNEKSYAQEAGRKALEDAMQRQKQDAKVFNGKNPGTYKIEYVIKNSPLVSLVIPFKDKPELLKMCIESILKKSTYKNFEIIGISNNSEEELTFSQMQRLKKMDSRVHFYEYNIPFNYSKINNYAVNHYAKGEHIVLLNNDIEIITPEWIEALLMHSQREHIGVVGAKLYYPNDTIQHAGVIVGLGGVAGHSHKNFHKKASGYFSRLNIVQNFSAVTAACFMVKKSIFDMVGGLNERELKVAFNDVDFCLRVYEKGYLNLFTPYCEAYHHESVSRGFEDTPQKQKRFQSEVLYMKERHQGILKNGDPFYNPNLTLEREDFSLRL